MVSKHISVSSCEHPHFRPLQPCTRKDCPQFQPLLSTFPFPQSSNPQRFHPLPAELVCTTRWRAIKSWVQSTTDECMPRHAATRDSRTAISGHFLLDHCAADCGILNHRQLTCTKGSKSNSAFARHPESPEERRAREGPRSN